MFNLTKAVTSLRQLNYDIEHGLLIAHNRLTNKQRKRIISHNTDIRDSLSEIYEQQAEQEGIAVKHSYKPRTMDFGIRLRKSKGQIHHPGGGWKK
jgi:hypothetical protein